LRLSRQVPALDSANDSVSHISHDAQVELTGRLGLRLEGGFSSAARLLQPYAQLNLWHGDGGRDTLNYLGGRLRLTPDKNIPFISRSQ